MPRAWLELLSGGRSSLHVGERLFVDTLLFFGGNRGVDLLLYPHKSKVPSGSIMVRDDVHVLRHVGPLSVNGDTSAERSDFVLKDGDILDCGNDTELRYVVEHSLRDTWCATDNWAFVDEVSRLSQRVIRREQGTPALRWAMRATADPHIQRRYVPGLSDERKNFIPNPPSCAVRAHHEVQDAYGHMVVIHDDIYGASLKDILSFERGQLDKAVGAHLALTLLHDFKRALRWYMPTAKNVHITLDGDVRFTGFLVHAVEQRYSTSLTIRREVAWLAMLLGLIDPVLDAYLAADEHNTLKRFASWPHATTMVPVSALPLTDAELIIAKAVIALDHQHVPTLTDVYEAIGTVAVAVPGHDRVTRDDLKHLVCGLFPERKTRDDELRDLLGITDLLDDDTVTRR